MLPINYCLILCRPICMLALCSSSCPLGCLALAASTCPSSSSSRWPPSSPSLAGSPPSSGQTSSRPYSWSSAHSSSCSRVSCNDYVEKPNTHKFICFLYCQLIKFKLFSPAFSEVGGLTAIFDKYPDAIAADDYQSFDANNQVSGDSSCR